MAKLKKEDIRELTTEEVVEKVAEAKLAFKKAKFNHAISPLDNPMVIRYQRKDISRLITELNTRKQAEKKAE